MHLDRLEQLAKEATPGPWRAERTDVYGSCYRCQSPRCHQGGTFVIANCGRVAHKEENAKYIAAANPATILALIRVAKAARKFLRRMDLDADAGETILRAEAELDEALAALEEPS